MPRSRRSKSAPRVFPILVCVLLFVYTGQTTVACESCRPLSIQEAPAVGLSLSPGHGTVAIQLVNGTTIDVGLIEGSQAYTQSWKDWQSTDLLRPPPPKPTNLQYFLACLGLWEPKPPALRTPRSLMPIVAMVQDIWQLANNTIILDHKSVQLAVPDFVFHSEDSRLQLEILLKTAGVHKIAVSALSTTPFFAFYPLGLCSYDGDNIAFPDCGKYNDRPIKSALCIYNDQQSIILRAVTIDEWIFDDDLKPTQVLWLDNNTDIEAEVRKFVADIDIDLVSVSGSHASASYDILEQVFQYNDKILATDYIRDAEECTFVASRRAAEWARGHLCNAEGCLQSRHCPVSKGCTAHFFDWPPPENDEL